MIIISSARRSIFEMILLIRYVNFCVDKRRFEYLSHNLGNFYYDEKTRIVALAAMGYKFKWSIYGSVGYFKANLSHHQLEEEKLMQEFIAEQCINLLHN